MALRSICFKMSEEKVTNEGKGEETTILTKLCLAHSSMHTGPPKGQTPEVWMANAILLVVYSTRGPPSITVVLKGEWMEWMASVAERFKNNQINISV